ncbi:4-hydroxythreonine-4-phosphate dehydrogenase PdxA [Pirellulaceae bacterium SH467]
MQSDSFKRPIVAITLGDPTGVGPEITAKSLADPKLQQAARFVVIGSPQALRLACHVTRVDLDIQIVDSPESIPLTPCQSSPQQVYCIPAGPDDWGHHIEPSIQAQGGQAAYDALVRATDLALAGRVDAVVTSPLQKKSLQLAGHDWPGHTELLAYLCNVTDHAMMLYLPPGPPKHGGPAGLGVVHVTLHMALRDVFEHITENNIIEKIQLAHRVFARIRRSLALDGHPKIAVTALNPHAGESGRFGDEEWRIIAPATAKAAASGFNVSGPYPVDTLMPKAAEGEFDAVVAMYHDQGHIALKLLDMFDAVNITLGLPIVRTSVAHGTAHDIAWRNIAKATGMSQAILTAVRLCGVANEEVTR